MEAPLVYCEFLSGFLTQPFNTVTHLTFLLAGLGVILYSLRHSTHHHAGLLLSVTTVLVGFSGAFWHHSNSPAGITLTVISIGLFVLALGALLFWAITGRSLASVLGAVGVVAAGFFVYLLNLPYLNGSLVYVVLVIVLLGALHHLIRQYPEITHTVHLSLCFIAVALVARMVDIANCDAITIGTHFIWHVAIAIGIYYLSVALIRVYHTQPV